MPEWYLVINLHLHKTFTSYSSNLECNFIRRRLQWLLASIRSIELVFTAYIEEAGHWMIRPALQKFKQQILVQSATGCILAGVAFGFSRYPTTGVTKFSLPRETRLLCLSQLLTSLRTAILSFFALNDLSLAYFCSSITPLFCGHWCEPGTVADWAIQRTRFMSILPQIHVFFLTHTWKLGGIVFITAS